MGWLLRQGADVVGCPISSGPFVEGLKETEFGDGWCVGFVFEKAADFDSYHPWGVHVGEAALQLESV